MGINDRDYVRKEGPSFLGSFTDRGTICKWLIGINVVFFVVQMLTRQGPGNDAFTDALVLDVNKAVFHGELWRLLTYAFLHDPDYVFHIIFNMLFLWWFGTELEDMYGPREFLIFYVVSAVCGGLMYCLANFLGFNGRSDIPVLGASGAVTAVLVLYACHFPTRVIRLFFFLPVPIWLLVVVKVGYDLFTMLGRQETRVAVAVHVGGAAFGFLYYRMNWRINPLLAGLWPSARRLRRQATGPRLRVYREEAPRPVPAAVSSGVDEDRIKAEMDAVLEKISRVGRDNLTPDDLDVLRRASEILRRRRT